MRSRLMRSTHENARENARETALVTPGLSWSARLCKDRDDQGSPLRTKPPAIAIVVRFGRCVRALAVTATVNGDRWNAEAHREVRVSAGRRGSRREAECLPCFDRGPNDERTVRLRAGWSNSNRVHLDGDAHFRRRPPRILGRECISHRGLELFIEVGQRLRRL